MEFKETKLENGLQIIAERYPSAPSQAVGFFVRTGSRDETDDISGVSHFLEHMVFKGTDRRSAMDLNLEFDRMGARYNAFTSQESTVYYAEVLSEFQDPLLDLLCDMMRPSLRTEDLDIEKDVICEEIAMHEDQPHFRLHDRLLSLYFADHDLGRSVLGTTDSITAMKCPDMRSYFRERYSPSNLTLAATGDIDFERFVETVRSLCGSWEDTTADRSLPGFSGTSSRESITDTRLGRQNIGLMSPAPDIHDEGRFAALILSYILGDVTGSRLYYALIDPAIADEAHISCTPMDDAGVTMTFVSCDPENAARALDTVIGEFGTFLKEGPTEEEILAAKNKMATGSTIKSEQPLGRLPSLGLEWVYREEYNTVESQIEKIFSITRDEIMRVADSCRLTEPAVLTLGPREGFSS